VMIYLIYICEGLRIDLIEAVEKKIQQNGEKYPVLKSKETRRAEFHVPSTWVNVKE
jgi:hypothetical protein